MNILVGEVYLKFVSMSTYLSNTVLNEKACIFDYK